MRLAALLTVICLALGLVGAVGSRAEEVHRPAVLFIGDFGGGCGYEVARRLHEAGFSLNRTSYPGLEETPLTWEQARRYNVIVVSGLGRSNADMTLTAGNQTTIDTLNRFLQAGGGVFVFPVFGQMVTGKPAQDAFLRPLGLTPLFDEQPYDSQGKVATSWRLTFGYTTALAPSPVTQGLTGIWYPAPVNRVGAQNHLIPLQTDDNWTTVISGAPSSYTKKGPLQADPPTEPGSFAQSVPLAAIREVGPGRLVCLGIVPEYLTGAHATTTLESIVLDRGLDGKPSGGYLFLENSLRWLAEPSLAGGELGGATMDLTMLDNPYKTRFGQPYAWPEQVEFPAVEPAWPGVIGARTAYSSGRGSVDEWVTAAKAQGLSFLVFLEEFAELSPGEFDQLKADCKRLSERNFAAIPGFTIDDEVGNHYFYFGDTFPYPDAKFLDPTGKFFVSRDPTVGGDPYQKGQLAMTVLDYAYSISSFRLTAGNYLFNQSAAPFANWFSNWCAVAVVTAQGEEVLEDFTAGYLNLAAFGNGPTPLALNLVDDPAKLAQTKWKTILRMPEAGGYTVSGRLDPETKFTQYFNNWNYYPDSPNKIYVSSGPAIESWAFVGPRDYGGDNDGDFVWQNNRWVLRGRASSPVGLQEVLAYDGERLFRRYLPGGAKEYEFVLDLQHDRQHNLIMVVTDTQGGKAVGGEQWDRNHRAEEFMCSDRNNQLSYGYLTRSDGTGILIGGNQTLATPNKRLSPNVSPAGTFKNDALLGAPAFDGAAGGEPDVIENLMAVLPDGKQVPSPQVTDSRRVMHTGDVNIGEGYRAWDFTDNIGVYDVWHTLWRTQPRTDFTVNRRNHFFNIDPDSPLPVFLWSTDIKLLQDLPNNGFMVAFLRTQRENEWVIRDSEGNVEAGKWDDQSPAPTAYHSASFGLNAYAALLDSPLGSVAMFPLSEGLKLSWSTPQRGQIYAGLDKTASPQQQGESARVDVLLLGIPRLTDYTRQFADARGTVERFWRDFGLDGGPTGYRVEAQTGKVTGQRYVLDLDGSVARCFSGKLNGKLISTLPLRVAGLNDRWSALLYDRKQRGARPVGVLENRAWAVVPMRGESDLFVGHPLVADRREVWIQVTQVAEKGWKAEVHNPTDRALRVTVRKNPYFDPLKDSRFSTETLEIPAGSSVWRDL